MLGIESQEAGRNFTLGRRRYVHDQQNISLIVIIFLS